MFGEIPLLIALTACNGKESPADDHIYGVGCHQEQFQVAQDAMNFGPEGHVNDSPWRCLMLCTYEIKTFSTNADLHVLLEAAGRIKRKSRKIGVRQLSDGTSSFVVRKFYHGTLEAFVVHPFVVHLVNSH
ncbi:unnamed protein product [Strongylus vulgaris]|uniref:Uncharacterized protein n=1 Tax=Strongylus vulgaris TaxID=40348 RepID=A0A3P7IW67_STRVU|nr:unnamed protein product [Strongylus vulgaris]